MNRFLKFTLLIVLLFITCALQAINGDTIYTTYKDGTFTTKCVVKVNASNEVMNKVIDDYLYQVKYNLDDLYKWALKGMKLRKESDDLIVFNFKSTSYDEESDLVKALGDVEVPNVVKLADVHVNSRWTKSKSGDRTNVIIDVKYSDAFLKKTSGIFQVIPYNKQSTLLLETKVQFGWFFNIFITKSMFGKIMEWRFDKMLKNIRTEAEKRYNLEISNQ